jgi:hypothetical protein
MNAIPTDRGNYMHTAPTGHKYWPFSPRPEEVRIETVAHHLATRARYNGATQHRQDVTKIFYSVAEHSVYCSLYVEEVLDQPEYALEALLHDSSEAFIGDLIRPLKYSPEFRAPFQAVEHVNEAVHAEAFNLVFPYPPAVKIADEAVCEAEIRQMIIRHDDEDWSVGKLHDDSNCAPYEVQMFSPFKAKCFFIDRYVELAKKRSTYRPLPARFVL